MDTQIRAKTRSDGWVLRIKVNYKTHVMGTQDKGRLHCELSEIVNPGKWILGDRKGSAVNPR